MTTLYTAYISTTGEIVGNYSSPDDIEPDVPLDQTLIEGLYLLEDFYIDLNTTTPTLKANYLIIQGADTIPGDGITPATFFNIPVGTIVDIPPAANDPFGTGASLTINDGSLEITYNYPGTYSIRFTNFKFIDQSYEVIVT